MSNRMKGHTALLTSTFALGLLLGSNALANDPAKAHDGKAHDTKAASEQPVTDTWITTKVKTDLLATKDVSGTEIKVETKNGVVTLAGTVATQAEVDNAVASAKAIKGVTRVDATGLKAASM